MRLSSLRRIAVIAAITVRRSSPTPFAAAARISSRVQPYDAPIDEISRLAGVRVTPARGRSRALGPIFLASPVIDHIEYSYDLSYGPRLSIAGTNSIARSPAKSSR